MKINKETIAKGIIELSNYYMDIDKKIQRANELENMIEAWYSSLQEINFEYPEANDDFMKAIHSISIKSKYSPSLYDLIEEMRNIVKNKQAEKENEIEIEIMRLSLLLENKYIINIKKAKIAYKSLLEKYTNYEINALVIEMLEEYKGLEYTIDFYLNEILSRI